MASSSQSKGIGFGSALLLIFITLKLTKTIDWSWWWVLSPLWLVPAIIIIICLIMVTIGYFQKE